MQQLKARVYSNEEKSIAHQRMLSDPLIKSYNDQIIKIHEMYSFPRRILIGEFVISDEIPTLPDGLQKFLDKLKKDKEDYILSNYPELSGP